jgi:hypothetical protein
MWAVSLEVVSCHPSGAQNLKVPPKFLENLWTPEYKC